MKTGEYDGVSASGDATLRLIAGGDVAAVNFDLIPNYKTCSTGLKNQPYNTVNGVGLRRSPRPRRERPDVRPVVVTTAPDSWSVVFEANSPYKGKVTAYDYAIYIADAALYLMKTKPELKHHEPVRARRRPSSHAAVDLLKVQHKIIGKYWGTAQEEIDGFANGDMVLGTAWLYQQNAINAAGGKPGQGVKPKEGATGWSDTWMISSKAAHPNCMYMWMDYIISPEANAEATVWFGEAPVSAAGLRRGREAVRRVTATSSTRPTRTYFKDVWYWNTPTTDVPRRPRRHLHGLLRRGPRPGPRSRASSERGPTPAEAPGRRVDRR